MKIWFVIFWAAAVGSFGVWSMPAPKKRQSTELKYLWVREGGEVVRDSSYSNLIEVAATIGISNHEHRVGAEIIAKMTRYMPSSVFKELSYRTSVGLFTMAEKTTSFREYEHLKDRPECRGYCTDDCAKTCTFDGRKYDSLVGVGGVRATCLNDNFMCKQRDPYYHQFNVLVHEFSHTVHTYALNQVFNAYYYNKILEAYRNALASSIWDKSSYAMVNEMEYFAEGAGVFFNTNHHPTSSGGMNSCNRGWYKFCTNESASRDWLQTKDPMLFEILSFTFTNGSSTLYGGLNVCP